MDRIPLPLATLIWVDPGSTTGLCVVNVRPSWLAGEGEPTFEGLRRAIRNAWFGQVGRDARAWVDGGAVKMNGHRVVAQPENRKSPVNPDSVLASIKGFPGLLTQAMVIDQCVDLLAAWPRAAWGYESFQLRQLGVDLSPVEVLSSVTHAELRYGKGRAPYQQTASQAKVTATDDRLKMAGLYRPGLPHAVDAARHAVVFLRRARVDPDLRADAWPRLFAQ